MANRVRTERLEIKLTKEEKELFQAKMRQAKCKSMNHFLRKCVLEKEIYTIDLKPFNELHVMLPIVEPFPVSRIMLHDVENDLSW